MNGKVKITDKTNYHIYVLFKNDCDTILKNKGNYITFFLKNKNIKKGDIVMLYQKDRSNSGFYGMVQLDTDVTYNENKVKVFSDLNLNRYYAKLKFKEKFADTIKPDVFIKYLSSDATGFKNVTSFKQKYVGKQNALIEFELYGKKIMIQLLAADQEQIIKKKETEEEEEEKKKKEEEEEDVEEEEKEEEEEQEEDVEEEEQEQEEEQEEEEEEVKVTKKSSKSSKKNVTVLKETKKSGKKNNIVVSKEGKKTSKKDTIKKEVNVVVPKDIVEPGYVPIMIVPCSNFQFPKNNREKYFVTHYKTCKKCEVINNNENTELIPILNQNNIEIFELTEDKHYYFEPALEAYFSLSNYEPADIVVRPFVRVIYVNNKHEDYNKCCLVTFCT